MFGIDFGSLFGTATSHAQVAISTGGNWLPAVSWIVSISVMLGIAAVLVVFFLKMLSLGIKLGIAAACFAFLAVVAGGYESKGEAKIQPLLNAANQRITNDEARAESFRTEAAAAQSTIVANSKAKKAALVVAAKANQDKLNAQPPTVTAAPLPRAVSVFVNTAISEAADAAFGPGAGDAARAAAASGAPINVGDFEAWAATAVSEHANAGQQVNRLLDINEALAKASATADAEHPPDASPTKGSP